MIIDRTGVAPRPDPERARQWLAEQHVFISSAMGDTAAERAAVAEAVRDEGAHPIWFEELGRDAGAEEAYLEGVDRATIYVGVLNEQYGRQLETGFSATETEYRRARELGKRVAVYSSAEAAGREGHLNLSLERIRVFITTESYSDVADLGQRVRRRLHELAGEALSPWVKLGDYVFRADEIADHGGVVTIKARVDDEIAHALEAMRDGWSRPRRGSTFGTRVADGDVEAVRRTIRAGGGDEFEIELRNVQSPQGDTGVATTGFSAEDLVEAGMRALLLDAPLPSSLGSLEFLADTGINRDDLAEAFRQPNEVAEAITRLVVTEGLVGSGRAARIVAFGLGPRNADTRQVEIEWLDPSRFMNVEPARRRLNGEWRIAEA